MSGRTRLYFRGNARRAGGVRIYCFFFIYARKIEDFFGRPPPAPPQGEGRCTVYGVQWLTTIDSPRMDHRLTTNDQEKAHFRALFLAQFKKKYYLCAIFHKKRTNYA